MSIKDGKLIRGPYKLEFCKEILRRLLDTQNQVRAEGLDPEQELIVVPQDWAQIASAIQGLLLSADDPQVAVEVTQ